MKKAFDCVVMKRRGAEKIHSQIGGMTTEQELAFWQKRTATLKQRQHSIRNRHRKSGRVVAHSRLVPRSGMQ